MIDEHARELVADCAVDEQRRDRRVDAAREAADHRAVADLGADALDLLGDDRLRAPRALTAADVLEEGGQDLLAVGGVDDLGVELDPVAVAVDVLERRHRRGGRRRQRAGALGRRVHGVAVRHPTALLRGGAGQQPPRVGHRELRAPELADLGALYPAAQLECEELHPVADAEHRDPEIEEPRIQPWRLVGVYRGGAARQDQALGPPPRDLLDRHVVREQLGEHAGLAHPPRDQLRVLPPVVEHHDLVGGGGAFGCGEGARRGGRRAGGSLGRARLGGRRRRASGQLTR